MGIDMKYIIAFLLLLPLFGCYSTETVEFYVHSVARTYGIQYGGEKYFEKEPKMGPTFYCNEIINGRFSKVSTNAQKAFHECAKSVCLYVFGKNKA